MTFEKIRQRARKLQRKTRWELFGNTSLAAVNVAISVTGILRAREPALRVSFAFALAWGLAGQYFLHRGMWPATLPGDAAFSTGLEFYRREIERRRYLSGRILQWSFGPAVLFIVTSILVMGGIAKNNGIPVQRMIPFCTLFAIWIIGIFVQRWRRQKELQREIKELSNMEKESSR